MTFENTFIAQTAIGLGGILLWFMKVRINPKDDRIVNLWTGFREHSYSLVISLIAYGLLAIVAKEFGQWSYLAAIASGYGAQSIFETVVAKGNFAGNIPPPKP